MPLAQPDPETAAPAAQRRKICFVAEQFVPPVYDGSTRVYKMWIDLLAQRYDLFVIFFKSEGGDDATASLAYLETICRAHLVLPGLPRNRLWKTTRALARLFTGELFAPRVIEELGRNAIQATIDDFVTRHPIDVFIFSKVFSIHLFGRQALERLPATVFLDLHDDFVEREAADRRVLDKLLRRFPSLRSYQPYRHTALRHRLSRFDEVQARRQESRLLRSVDCLLSSSQSECSAYRRRLGAAMPCEFLPWPIDNADDVTTRGVTPRNASPVPFDAGFLGGDNPFNLEAVLFFCAEILPLIRAKRPAFRCLIAGRVTKPLALLGLTWPGVVLEGFAPGVQSFYGRVATAVVPLLSGTGVSVKTLEALDRGVPTIATPLGARGIDVAAHPHLTVAADPRHFAEALLASLATHDAARDEAPAARSMAAQQFFLAEFERLVRKHERMSTADRPASLWRRAFGST
jgi:glycosyltransferase involved in cell wall biosynthesis